jgi:hypothetical protein
MHNTIQNYLIKNERKRKMDKENEKKYIVEESKCERCGNEFLPFQVIENDKVVNKGYYPDCECIVEIKLKKWQIPILLGAASLGNALERISSCLYEAIDHGSDSDMQAFLRMDHSILWRKNVDLIVDQIKSQSSIYLEYWESANDNDVQSIIENFVDKEVERRTEIHRGYGLNREWLNRNFPEE